jgi:hypothetical protein
MGLLEAEGKKAYVLGAGVLFHPHLVLDRLFKAAEFCLCFKYLIFS